MAGRPDGRKKNLNRGTRQNSDSNPIQSESRYPHSYKAEAIPGGTQSTVTKHVQEIFERLGVETRGGATLRALEAFHSVAAPENP